MTATMVFNGLILLACMGRIIYAEYYLECEPEEQQVLIFKKEEFNQSSDFECAICLEEVTPTILPVIESCPHRFHSHCMKELIHKKFEECPLCRKRMIYTTL